MIQKNILMGLFIFIGKLFFAQNNEQPKIDSLTKIEVVNSICNSLTNNYVFPDKAKVMSDLLKQQNQNNIFSSITDPNQFANEIQKTLRSVNKDNHLRIEYNPRLEKDIIKFLENKKGSNAILADQIKKDEKQNFYFKKLEILPSNIGYIEFTNFAVSSPSTRKTVHSAMQFISHTDGLIIDLRNNFGGNGKMSEEILSYFFPVKTYTGKTYNRIENKWSNSYVENKKEITNGLKLKMPLYILISNRTFSAAESFAYTLQSMKKAVIIGNTSRGGAHATRSFSIGNGFVAFIPYLRGENVTTKTDWDGVGVIPDIRTEDNNCILTAQNHFLNQKLLTEKDENEKRKINWQINFNKSKSSAVVINVTEATRFTGQFSEFEVTLSGNQLMFRDTNQKSNEPRKAIAITANLFQIGTDYQVEFITDSNNVCNAIKMYWDDGYEETIDRTK
ncbi:archaellum component FlaF (FlaF/FlaG flagellin family) [Epilithonimonas hungarica]|uniref:S41 family peptidase n=1 Tax=Epilithonimonas hungarica TaxID=454006 RepID=UPI00278ACD89|nr:S41 family peptidase [Epilithonimonas hungarica]MDP9955466.1 archaellum component FlaF (FlaF/FlaG flagellin family) [Epilithonimonas hungarica]